MTDADYMNYCLHLAKKAQGRTSPNPMVGAVVVKAGKIVAEGWHKFCGADHAEVDALKKINYKAQGATLYVNLEPCSHFGRTPPCVDTLIQSKIKRVVIGMKDPNPIVNGRAIKTLKKNKIDVTVGVLQEECEKLNEHFIKYISQKRPFVVAKSAQSLDGKIALENGQSKWITSDETRTMARRKRAEFDAIMVGIETVLKDNPQLNVLGSLKKIKKIIVDSHLRTPLSAKLFKGVVPQQCVLATTKKASDKKIKLFQKEGVAVLVDPSGQARVNVNWLLKELAKQNITSILIEGGAALIGSFLKEQLVDKMHIYIAPKILGDRAQSSVKDFKVKDVNKTIVLNDISLEVFEKDLFLEGYLQYP